MLAWAWRKLGYPILLASPALLLISASTEQYRDGVATDRAIPVPSYIVANIPRPKDDYIDCANALASANPDNGNAHITRGEAVLLARDPVSIARAEVEKGLSLQPASARGWLLLGEIEMRGDKSAAAKYLKLSFLLAPNDYWLLGARLHDAAILWEWLDPPTQRTALEGVRSLWLDQQARFSLIPLSQTLEGRKLIVRAYANDREKLRKISRWLIHEFTYPSRSSIR